MAKANDKEKKDVPYVPPELDKVYELKIMDVEHKVGVEKPWGKVNAVYLTLFILGTEDARRENLPHMIRFVEITEVAKLSFKDLNRAEGGFRETKGYKLLKALGLEPPNNLPFSSVPWEKLDGMYLKGLVTGRKNKEGKVYPEIDLDKNLRSLTNKEHLEFNQSRRELIFPSTNSPF